MSEGSLKVFTRSQHLEEVGFTSNDQVLCDVYTVATGGCEQSDGSGVESLAQRNGSSFLDEGGAVTSKRKDIAEMYAAEIQPDPCGEETQWEQFKSEFTDTLESSEQHIEEETRLGTQGAQDVRCLRQQLLIDAITALHSETVGEENQAATHSATGAEQIQESPESWSTVDTHLGEGAASIATISDMTHLSSYPSNSSDALSLRQTAVLSLGRLETIHESKLDRMLELVESGTQPEAVRGESPINGSRGQGRKQPHPPLVWDTNGETDSEVLMKELEQLSQKQSKQTVSTGTSTCTDTRDTQQGRYTIISENRMSLGARL